MVLATILSEGELNLGDALRVVWAVDGAGSCCASGWASPSDTTTFYTMSVDVFMGEIRFRSYIRPQTGDPAPPAAAVVVAARVVVVGCTTAPVVVGVVAREVVVG